MKHEIGDQGGFQVGIETYRLADRAATARFGEALGSLLRPGDVVALNGELGAGKTTLTQALARGMGITEPVTSPTFSLVQEYSGPTPLFHFDPYRLNRPEAFADLGFEDYLERGAVIVIEWADRLGDLLPLERLNITLEILEGEGEDVPRLLTAETIGVDYTGLLAELRALPEIRELHAGQRAA